MKNKESNRTDIIESQGGVGDEEWVKVGEKPTGDKADTFRYRFVYCRQPTKCCLIYSVTNDVYRVQNEHRVRWPGGYVEYIGEKVTRADALLWLSTAKVKYEMIRLTAGDRE